MPTSAHAQIGPERLNPQPSIELFQEIVESPKAVALGDVDGDGILDLVAANLGFDVSVLYGDGGGGFDPAVGSPFGVGARPVAVALGDFDGDGHLDITTAHTFDFVSVLLGDGEGGFTLAANSPFSVGDSPASIAVGDLDGDGILDLVTANENSNDVSILIGDGNGNFSSVAGSPFAVGAGPTSVAIGDLNGDGNLDLVTANSASDDASVLRGNGAGGFTVAPGDAVAVGDQPESVALGDINGDGNVDLITANRGTNSVSTFIGAGDFGFLETLGSPFDVGSRPVSVALTDANVDGDLDVVVASTISDNVSVLIGNGGGDFTPASGSPYSVGEEPEAIAIGDINDDGFPDLATADGASDSITLLVGNGSGGFSNSAASPLLLGGDPSGIALGDLDGDGVKDAITAFSSRDQIAVLRSNGNGRFDLAAQPIVAGDQPIAVALGDIDGDGALDVVSANFNAASVSVLVGDGVGSFSAVVGSPFSVGGGPQSVALGDVDGDGNVDIATANRFSNDVSVLMGDGSGGFVSATSSPFVVGSRPQSVVFRDIDGSGNLDIATANSGSDDVSILLGDGNGAFNPAPGSPVAVGIQPAQLALGDVNDDGLIDLVTANSFDSTVSVLAGAGNGALSEVSGSPFDVGSFPISLGLDDVNGDGALDIVSANSSSDNVSVLLGDNNGGFPSAFNREFSVGGRPRSIALADVDGDGIADAVIVSDGRTSSDEKLTVLTTDILFEGSLEFRTVR